MQKQSQRPTNFEEYCSFRLPETELQQLNATASVKGVKRSQLIREVLKSYLASAATAA